MLGGTPTADELSFRRNLAGGVFAMFAAGAGIAQGVAAPDWLKLAFAGIAVIGAVITLIFLFKERSARAAEQQARLAEAERVRSSVGLDVTHDGDDGRLWVSNRGLHVIRDIEISAIPDDEDWMPETHGSFPLIHKDAPPGVTLTTPILGGWFHAQVIQLSPGRGICVVRYHDRVDDYQQIDMDLNWNDHDGRQRKAHVVANLRECVGALAVTSRNST
jgi:hypothetical protein